MSGTRETVSVPELLPQKQRAPQPGGRDRASRSHRATLTFFQLDRVSDQLATVSRKNDPTRKIWISENCDFRDFVTSSSSCAKQRGFKPHGGLKLVNGQFLFSHLYFFYPVYHFSPRRKNAIASIFLCKCSTTCCKNEYGGSGCCESR